MGDERGPAGGVIAEVAAGAGVTLAQAARRFPASRGRATSPSTVCRWLADGVALPGGRRVRLEAARQGGRRRTTEAAIRRFLAAQQPVAPDAAGTAGAAVPGVGGRAPAGPRAPGQRRRAAERAGEELARRFGI